MGGPLGVIPAFSFVFFLSIRRGCCYIASPLVFFTLALSEKPPPLHAFSRSKSNGSCEDTCLFHIVVPGPKALDPVGCMVGRYAWLPHLVTAQLPSLSLTAVQCSANVKTKYMPEGCGSACLRTCASCICTCRK